MRNLKLETEPPKAEAGAKRRQRPTGEANLNVPMLGRTFSKHWKIKWVKAQPSSNDWKCFFQRLEMPFRMLCSSSSKPIIHLSILPILILLAGGVFAEEEMPKSSARIDSGKSAEAVVEAEGAAHELVQACQAIEEENYQEAMRHLARVQTLHYREVKWQPAALFYEALIDERMGTQQKISSALDELKTLYPTSRWCERAKKELMQKETERGASE